MKNPFDNNPFDDNNPLDIFGNPADPNPHDGFQSHDPAFQDNSPYNQFGSEWGANHPDPSAFDPVQPAPHDHPNLSEINAHLSKLDPDYLDPSDPSEFDPVQPAPHDHPSLSEINARISESDPEYLNPSDPSDFDPVDPSELDARISEVNARISELDPDYPSGHDPSDSDPVPPDSHDNFHPRDWGSGHHGSHHNHPGEWGAEHHGHHEHQAHHSGSHHSGWTSPLPDDQHPHSHDPNWTPHQDHHTFGSAANPSARHFESSSDSPYITISDSGPGYVYLNGHKEIGRIDGYTVYNSQNLNCGHWTKDGKVYDYYDNLVGWIEPNGGVYVKGRDGEVYHTDKGVAGGAAYILLVWCGGQTHV